MAYRGDSGLYDASSFAAWAVAHHVNCVRISPAFIKSGSYGSQNRPPQTAISGNIAPLVNALKAKKIYTIIDYHEYMADYNSSGGSDFVPWGDIWDVDNPSYSCQKWLDDWEYLAYYFKDEPWVVGYELCNEPRGSSPNYTGISNEMCRKNYIRCLQNIRKIDSKHIIFLGNSSFTSPRALKSTWEDGLASYEQYRPDYPYDQVVFTFHEYIRTDDIYVSPTNSPNLASELVGRVQKQFQVPLFCSETGSAIVDNSNPTLSEIRVFQQETLEICSGEKDFWKDFMGADKAYPSRGIPKSDGKIGFSIWTTRSYDYDSGSEYQDIWEWAAQRMQSSAPVAAASVVAAHHISCQGVPLSIFSNGGLTTIAADIVDSSGNRIFDSNAQVVFSIIGAGTWEDGSTANKQLNAVNGVAAIKVKSTSVGTISVTAASAGLASGNITINSVGGPVKVFLSADKTSIPADGSSMITLTGYIKDSSNNIVTMATGTFIFSVNDYGTFWISASSANQRDVVGEGKTYINFKAGTVPGKAVITATVAGLTPGAITVYVGSLPPVENVKMGPNPFVVREGLRIKFIEVPTGAQLSIYNISGELVRRLSESNFEIEWDAKNERGDFVSSGIYIYVLKDTAGNKKTGKIAVIK
ncbi:MAG: hypothetical protein A3J83_08725 [Elusimicrobia bacterium RIFOXYA2_FULL_40_6]|nr:MAG: hypothetical protein A3J83_08725 [Elusimicrobia bacterium RIFOXYA2_FULL_40_6]